MEDNMELEESVDSSKDNEADSSKFKKGIIFGILIGVTVACAGFFGMWLYYTSPQDDSEPIDNRTLKKIQSIERVIDKNFYAYNDETSTDRLKEGIFRGMVDSLGDKYAEYYSKEELEEELNDDAGISYGIGCTVSFDDDGMPTVIGVLDESPAQSGGVQAGDIIYKVNGESTSGLSLSEVVGLIKGPENTQVEITFLRGEEYIEMTLIRGKVIETTSVVYGTLLDNDEVGYIRISEFDKATVGQYTDAMKELTDLKIKGLVLDLRSNPGGDFAAALDIARQILPEGLIVYTEDKNGKRKEYTCDGANELKIPLTVLVNEYSASASEILAGAIQDHNKGTLIGTQTYGKGIVQRIFDIGDGSAVKITISAYFTPNGRNIHDIGIAPDIELEYDAEAAQDAETDNQVDKALEVLEQQMK